MPNINLQQFSVTPASSANVNIPRFLIECRVVDSDGTVYADFTGANRIVFPAVMSALTTAQRQALIEMLVNRLILMRAGFDDGS